VKQALHTSLFIILALFGVAISSSGLAAESHYRWIDKSGNPVHSDRPPPKGVDYEVVSSGTSLVRKVNSSEGVVPAETEPSVGNEFNQLETKPELKKNPEYCKRAQDNMHTLNTSARIRIRDDQGDYRFIDEEEKEEQRKEAQAQIARHCE